MRIECANPGEPIKVLVRSADDRSASPIQAKGTLEADSTRFNVEVKTSAGIQTHSRDWDSLRFDTAAYEKND